MLLYYYVGTGVCPKGTEGTLSSIKEIVKDRHLMGEIESFVIYKTKYMALYGSLLKNIF